MPQETVCFIFVHTFVMAKRSPWSTLTGASWLYPFKGIVFFVLHPAFYPLLRSRLLPIILLSLFIYTNLFTFTYLPQVAFLAIFQGRAGAWLNATFLVLGEGAAIVALLFEAFFVDETLVDVFDAVLIQQGLGELVKRGRVVDETTENPIKALGKPTESAIYSPFSLRQIVEFVFFLPLNFIPWIGVPLFLFITGYRAGPFHHWRYFQFMGLNKKERKEFIKRRQIKYTLFGTVALLFQLIPGLSMIFLLTTATGSALWIAKIEKARLARDAREQQRQQADEGEYHDDPV